MKESKFLVMITLVAMLFSIFPLMTFSSVIINPEMNFRDAKDQSSFNVDIVLIAQNEGDISATQSNINQRKFIIGKPDGWNFISKGSIIGTGKLSEGAIYPEVSLVDGNLEVTLSQSTAEAGDRIIISNAQLKPNTDQENYLNPGVYHSRIINKSSQVKLEGIDVGTNTGTIVASISVECSPFWDISGEWDVYLDHDEDNSSELELIQNSEGTLTGNWITNSITNGEISCEEVEFRVLKSGGYYDIFKGVINPTGTLISGTYESFLGSISEGNGTWEAYGRAERILDRQRIVIDHIENLTLTQTQLDVGYNVSVTGWVNFNSDPNPKLKDLTLEVKKETGNWEVVGYVGPNLNQSSLTLNNRGGQQGREFNFTWEASEKGTYSFRVMGKFTPELDYPSATAIEGPFTIGIRGTEDESDGFGEAAATSIATKILKDAGVDHRYFTGEYKKNGQPIYSNYISDVAKAMEQGASFPIYNFSKTKIGYAEKSDGSSYYNAVFNYLKYVLGADI